MGKPFKTYEELVAKLRDEKGLTINAGEEERVIALLKKYSYFSLVSGYKNLFKANDGTYLSGTTIEDIFALYSFDDELRDIFFHAIQIVEKTVKSLLSYTFVNKYGDKQEAYLSPLNYDAQTGSSNEVKRQSEIKKLIATFSSVVIPPLEHNYTKHQWSKHQNIPLWAAVKAVTFGTISKMYSLCEPQVQSDIAKEYPNVSKSNMVGMLDMLSRVRNVCAHNERLFDFSVTKSRAIPDMPVHSVFGISKNKAGLYNQGKTDLFAALICLKYLLSVEDFEKTVDDIENAMKRLLHKTKKIPPNKILKCMGFPQNWINIR